jgi:hypothetical protein
MPIWARPFAPPPLRVSPILGLLPLPETVVCCIPFSESPEKTCVPDEPVESWPAALLVNKKNKQQE